MALIFAQSFCCLFVLLFLSNLNFGESLKTTFSRKPCFVQSSALGSGQGFKSKGNEKKQSVADKEQEFQALLDSLLVEAKAKRGSQQSQSFSIDDLTVARTELQKLQRDDRSKVISLKVPTGVKPGELIVVNINNSLFEIEIPEGTKEGDEIEVEISMGNDGGDGLPSLPDGELLLSDIDASLAELQRQITELEKS